MSEPTLRQSCPTVASVGSTLNPPSGHQPISSGTLDGGVFSFSIDIERDPQSDDFHGLWHDFGNGNILNISGKGSGPVREADISGTLKGVFAFYAPTAPPPNTYVGRYCQADDHRFTFHKQ